MKAGLTIVIGLSVLFFLFKNQQLHSSENTNMSVADQTIELVYGEGEPNHAIIWLHGLGASSSDFPPVVPELGLNTDRAIRFIFPQAPNRPITVNGGMVMPGWYDIKGMNIEDKQDAKGMAESKQILDDFIDAQLKLGIPSENIVIAGFSQGGAVAYHTVIRSQHKFAGVLALSTYLPFAELVIEEQTKVNIQTPILAQHGSFDPVVPHDVGKQSAEHLSNLGYQVTWQSYPMQHQVVLEQLQDIGEWINRVFD